MVMRHHDCKCDSSENRWCTIYYSYSKSSSTFPSDVRHIINLGQLSTYSRNHYTHSSSLEAICMCSVSDSPFLWQHRTRTVNSEAVAWCHSACNSFFVKRCFGEDQVWYSEGNDSSLYSRNVLAVYL